MASELTVDITATALLNPSPPSSPPVLGTKLPLTFFDLAVPPVLFKLVIAFRAPTPPDELLRSSFSGALAHFPAFAGRLVTDDAGRRCVALNDTGARLVEARAPVALSDVEFTNAELEALVPACDGGAVEELLLLQLTRFACGGLAVGAAVNHLVADTHSVDLFLTAWADICRGRDVVVPSPAACLMKRAELIAPRNPLRVQFPHLGTDVVVRRRDWSPPTHAVKCLAVVFSPEFIAALRASAPGATSFECLFAHLWKKITVARAVDDGETSGALVVVNCRKRMRPPLPEEFFGNVVLCAHLELTAGKLKRGTVAATAGAIHDAVARIDDSYIRSFIDFGKEMEGGEDGGAALVPNSLRVGRPGNPDVVVSSWLGFGMPELDLGAGGGTPAGIHLPEWWRTLSDGFVMLLPSCEATAPGGVVAHVGLSSDAAHEFYKICYQA